jgi:RimJ/RimL family protein N-acetyltransferase
VLQETVETERLWLRRLEETNLDKHYRRIFADPDVMQTLRGGIPLSRSEFEDRVRPSFFAHWVRHGFGPWIIERKIDTRLIGHCGLRFWPDSSDVELFYAIERPAWGNGYATEAASASIDAGFCALHLECISACIAIGNRASSRVLEKLGMGRTHECDLNGMRVVMYEIHRSEWNSD